MLAWRISNHADLSGAGGIYKAGRWNHFGTLIVYLSDHPALSMLEVLVHFDPSDLPETYQLVSVDVPDDLISFNPDLPEDWRIDESACRDFFQHFSASKEKAALLVPSIIMPKCANLLLNPDHPRRAEIKIVEVETYRLDPRFRR